MRKITEGRLKACGWVWRNVKEDPQGVVIHLERVEGLEVRMLSKRLQAIWEQRGVKPEAPSPPQSSPQPEPIQEEQVKRHVLSPVGAPRRDPNSLLSIVRAKVAEGLRCKDLYQAVLQVKVDAKRATVYVMASKILAGKL